MKVNLLKRSYNKRYEDELADQINRHQLPTFKREYCWHPIRRFRSDFVFVDQKLIVEFEGGLWQRGGGGHSHPLGILRDIEKYNEATILGYRVLRFTDKDIKNLNAIEKIKKLLG